MTADAVARLTAALSGSYAIERELGAGGMATVYLAEDLKHHRKVAIKVLREDLAASLGPTRFLREIEIAAQLQHPHILPLLDSGNVDGFLFYVMPFVTGQSLRERIGREGELPLHEAVRLLMEVVDALAHAHAHGVVHRDIKPDNVMLSGRHALVADFGVAKAVSEATGRNTVTTLGVAVGTPTYMSPEQAAADPHIDHRSDIYAVGVMAYELLAGRPPFTGATPQQVLAAHVTEEPDPVSKRRPGVSPALEQVVMRCLAKRPADRWQTADELLAQLEPLSTPSGGVTPAQMRPVAGLPPRWRVPLFAGVGLLIVGAAAALLLRPSPPPSVVLGQSTQVTSDAGLEILPSIAPDGKFVAYAAGTSARMRIFVRPVAGGRTIPLTDDTTGVQSQPRWSPDGANVLFLAGGGVLMAPAMGGAARPLVPPLAESPVLSATWSGDGRQFAFTRKDSLFVADLAGLATHFVAKGHDLHSCAWSPVARRIACVSGNSDFVRLGPLFGNTAPSTIVIIDAANGHVSTVTDSVQVNQSPVWTPDGKALYYVSNRQGPRDIYASSIRGSGKPSGEPVRLTTGLNAMTIALAGDGKRLAYAIYSARANIWALPIPSGPPVSVATSVAITSGSQVIEGVRVTRDGKNLVFDSNLRGTSALYRVSVSGGEPERLNTDSVDNFQPVLSPDGTELAYHTMRGGVRQLFILPVNGGPIQQVFSTQTDQRIPDWSPDGNALVYEDKDQSTSWRTRRGADRRWERPVLIGHFNWPKWSPDGKLVIGNSVPQGAIVVAPADSGAERIIYSPRPGSADPSAECPSWSSDGRSVYFKSHDARGDATIWSIPVTGGTPRLLVRFDDPTRPSTRPELIADGKRFYFTINDRQSDVWVVELTRK